MDFFLTSASMREDIRSICARCLISIAPCPASALIAVGRVILLPSVMPSPAPEAFGNKLPIWSYRPFFHKTWTVYRGTGADARAEQGPCRRTAAFNARWGFIAEGYDADLDDARRLRMRVDLSLPDCRRKYARTQGLPRSRSSITMCWATSSKRRPPMPKRCSPRRCQRRSSTGRQRPTRPVHNRRSIGS